MNAPQVLIVEDDAILRGALCQTMEYGGYQVLNARNGKDALAVMDRETVDWLLAMCRWMKWMAPSFYKLLGAASQPCPLS